MNSSIIIQEKFFILIGGLGTRLRSVISEVPKVLAPIEGKPFLWYKIMQLKEAGFRRFVFCAGYLAEQISDFFGDGSKFGVEIEYSIEDEPLGTGGAIKHATQFIDGPFFVGNGDTYLEFSGQPMLDFIHKSEANYCMLLTPPHEKGQEGMVATDSNGMITNFMEKPKEPTSIQKINAGIYYLSPSVLDLMLEGQKISMERDIFPDLIEKGKGFYGFDYEGYFIDIGLPKNYFRFVEDIKKEKVHFS